MPTRLDRYVKDNEVYKFVEKNDEVAVRIFDEVANSLVPNSYDYIELGYTGDNLTSVVYKKGGSGGTIVATLTLAYSGDNLVSVTKS